MLLHHRHAARGCLHSPESFLVAFDEILHGWLPVFRVGALDNHEPFDAIASKLDQSVRIRPAGCIDCNVNLHLLWLVASYSRINGLGKNQNAIRIVLDRLAGYIQKKG